ncbi:DUF3558 domain-containing protein [Amycolatopsis sp. NPDC059021]|uniref:DUF3558 domain-containing protein n=1 Tax=Amycolatopsis sp. NPDC059021 TaxID=3346704 RepID=UPI0036701EFA
MSRRPLLFVVAAAALTVAGCSGTTGGTASPAPASATDSNTGGSGGGSAPKVPAPLNVSSIQSNACATLSSAKVSQLKLSPGTPRTGSAGPSCTFTYADDHGNQIDVSTVTANKNGLSDVYDTKANDEYFEPTQIAGYPAVYAAALDHRGKGKCGLFVGVTDQLSVNILAQLDNGADAKTPCPVVAKVGEAIVQTLKEG